MLNEVRGGNSGALKGFLVLDFGQAAVGPIAAEYLGMLGATVIKVESPRGDMVRNGSPVMRGTSTTFIGNNLTKYGIVLDLKSSDGVAQAKQLIALADVLAENFRSSEVMVRLGLGYDVLSEINPNLVYLSSSAYGRGGPLENMLSNEWLTEAVSGFTSLTGAVGGPGEFSRGTANLDWNGAMVNTVALLAALVRRERGNGGSYLATSQLGSSVYAGITRFAEVLAGGSSPQPLGCGNSTIVPDDAFRTRDGYMAVSAPTERSWARLCTAIGLPSLTSDERFATNAARLQARTALTELLGEVFAERTSADWCELLASADVPCAPFPGDMGLVESLEAHAQIASQRLVSRVPSAYGEVVSQSPHWAFSRTPAGIDAGPPLHGEHTDVVLAHLGSKQELLDALAQVRDGQRRAATGVSAS